MSDLKSYLFETNAIKVSKGDKPFWYTSGKIGPYFINTHFVYGSEADANDLLKFIDENKHDKLGMPKPLFEKVKHQYDNNKIYSDVINEMVSFIKNTINVDDIDYISGGERRDWFFSYMIAFLLNKPHITVFKDLACVTSDCNFNETVISSSISGKKVLHITDLITVASSFIRAWIPAIQDLGGELVWALSVVDRLQGGKERLADLGITTYSLTCVDEALFNTASQKGIIDQSQLDMVHNFIKDPDGSMREFLINHPDFIEDALNADEKTAGRARLLVDGNLYNL
ncbi:orotate phosphoribosyltransferase [Thomasclavelia cocleata]|uniref:orotate phosphoribosyltransferase n=1 Tax=Thomasclavelia cocleata TaxID=69824 RepID=UPI00272DEA09|nr:hypothetical protein [Thomasclavelia cocleata]